MIADENRLGAPRHGREKLGRRRLADLVNNDDIETPVTKQSRICRAGDANHVAVLKIERQNAGKLLRTPNRKLVNPGE